MSHIFILPEQTERENILRIANEQDIEPNLIVMR
jgi:hypothetical protein